MKNKIVMVAVGLMFLFMVSACSKEEQKVSTNEKQIDDTVTMRLITDRTGISDKSFNASAWEGIVEFYGDTVQAPTKRGLYYDTALVQNAQEYVNVVKATAEQDVDLICMNGFTFADALSTVAPLYPDKKFMIADVSWLSGDNIMQIAFAEEQGSYLVGMIAALKAKEDGIKNPKFGFIGGVPGFLITKFEMGYIQGIRAVLPKAVIVDYYANDFGKPELAREQAKKWYDSGVYTIFSAAGGTGNGTIAQAKEYRMQGKNVWAIGVDSDQYENGIYDKNKSAVLTSMIKRINMASLYALNSVKNKTFKAETVVLDLAKAGLGFSKRNKELSIEIINEVNIAKQKIINGSISVVSTYAEALKKGLVPEGLGAKDE